MDKAQIDKARALQYAFAVAARNGQADVVVPLLQAGVDIHAGEDLALRGAAEFGQTEMVRFLLEHGADLHAKNDQALLLADARGHKATAALIMQWMKKSAPGPWSSGP